MDDMSPGLTMQTQGEGHIVIGQCHENKLTGPFYRSLAPTSGQAGGEILASFDRALS